MTNWQDLDEELDQWHNAAEPATLWWRDDDAAKDVPALERLIAVAEKAAVPLHLAVIPAILQDRAAELINNSPYTRVLQHGFSHTDHAPKGQGSWELGDHRPLDIVIEELKKGAQVLRKNFPDKFLPVQVPPWTRISPEVAAQLSSAGYVALSMEGNRRQNLFDSYVKVINPHCDPIKWKENAKFKGTQRVLDELVGHLKDRRAPAGDRDEITGLCTHHRDHSEELWEFLELFTLKTARHTGARWVFLDDYLT